MGHIDFHIGVNPPDNGEYIVLANDRTISTAWWNGEYFVSTNYIHVIAWAKADEKVLFTFKDEKKLRDFDSMFGIPEDRGCCTSER